MCEVAGEMGSYPVLTTNPCRLGVNNPDFDGTRKPLVAAWELSDSEGRYIPFYTINVHQRSKFGSLPVAGSLQPYINGGSEARVAQNIVVGKFATELVEAGAKLVVALGDFNEF